MRKITETDLAGKGNLGRPDIPGVSTAEMQRILDELSREVIVPAFNELSGQVETAVNDRYTKEEADRKLNEKVFEIGAGDMAKSVYDPGNNGVSVTVQPWSCTKADTVYTMTGVGSVGRCKIPADWVSGDTFSVNGNVVPAYCGADTVDGDTIVAGRWVLFTYDGNRLDFNGGGGLSASKLAQATATPGDVLAGKSFYATGKKLKDGSMPNRGNWGASIAPGGAVTVPAGYHNGSGQVAVRAARLRRKVLGNFNTNQYEGPFSATFSVTDLPGWKNFTTENFAFSYASVNANAQDQNTGFSYSLSYNPSSGIVTVTNNYSYSSTPYFQTSGTVTCVCYYAE